MLYTPILDWIAKSYVGFVVDLVRALLIATFMSHRRAVKGQLAGARGWCRHIVAAGLRRALVAVESVKTSNEESTGTLNEEGVVGGNLSLKEEEDTKIGKKGQDSGDGGLRPETTTIEQEEMVDEQLEIVRQPRPFEFRDRLWHEPPEGQDLYRDYDYYEEYEEAQKEFKEIGGRDLEWKTSWLDLHVEESLVRDYLSWTQEVAAKSETAGQKKESDFYAGLVDNLKIDLKEVRDQGKENCKRHGKTDADDWALRTFMVRIHLKKGEAEFNRVMGNNRVSIPITERPANWQPGDPAIF